MSKASTLWTAASSQLDRCYLFAPDIQLLQGMFHCTLTSPALAEKCHDYSHVVASRTGKHVEAEQMHRKALEVMQRVLGAEHPRTIAARESLSKTLRAQGKHYRGYSFVSAV